MLSILQLATVNPLAASTQIAPALEPTKRNPRIATRDPKASIKKGQFPPSIVGMSHGSPGREAIPRAKADAERAVQLDGGSAEAHTVLAATRAIYDWDWKGAQQEFQRAIELNPGYAPAHQWYGQSLCDVGRFEECLAETDRAHALDPAYLTAAVDVGNRRYEARQYAEAIPPIKNVLEFDPDFLSGHRYLGLVYEGIGCTRRPSRHCGGRWSCPMARPVTSPR